MPHASARADAKAFALIQVPAGARQAPAEANCGIAFPEPELVCEEQPSGGDICRYGI